MLEIQNIMLPFKRKKKFYINMPQCKNTTVYFVLFAMCEKVTTMNITIAADPFDN